MPKRKRQQSPTKQNKRTKHSLNYADFVKEPNQCFTLFYHDNKIFDEATWQNMVLTMQKPLPSTWRIHFDSPYVDHYMKYIGMCCQDEFEADGETFAKPNVIDWYFGFCFLMVKVS